MAGAPSLRSQYFQQFLTILQKALMPNSQCIHSGKNLYVSGQIRAVRHLGVINKQWDDWLIQINSSRDLEADPICIVLAFFLNSQPIAPYHNHHYIANLDLAL